MMKSPQVSEIPVQVKTITNRLWLAMMLCVLVFAHTLKAERYIVRTVGGPPPAQNACNANGGCNTITGLGDPSNAIFLITTPPQANPQAFLNGLATAPGILSAEPEQVGKVLGATASGGVPPALYDNAPISYFGTTVWNGYVNQPASLIVNLPKTQSTYGTSGAGTVAVIDTGIDATHPAFQNMLVPGYDFIRNQSTADEKSTVNLSKAPTTTGVPPAYVNDSTAAVVDDSTAAVVDNSAYAAFGHGTMVAGVIHLVSPTTKIMPLRAFNVDGTGNLSTVIQAIYFAIGNGAKILNMSFSFSSTSPALNVVLTQANVLGLISVASAGNDGQQTVVYPAAYSTVMGVASTTNNDTLSVFSNYGTPLVWVGAPGEGIVTPYPFGTYAAGWGTSLSTPFVSGAAALLLSVQANCNQTQAAQAIANAKFITPSLGNGRVDLYQAVQAWRSALGLP